MGWAVWSARWPVSVALLALLLALCAVALLLKLLGYQLYGPAFAASQESLEQALSQSVQHMQSGHAPRHRERRLAALFDNNSAQVLLARYGAGTCVMAAQWLLLYDMVQQRLSRQPSDRALLNRAWELLTEDSLQQRSGKGPVGRARLHVMLALAGRLQCVEKLQKPFEALMTPTQLSKQGEEELVALLEAGAQLGRVAEALCVAAALRSLPQRAAKAQTAPPARGAGEELWEPLAALHTQALNAPRTAPDLQALVSLFQELQSRPLAGGGAAGDAPPDIEVSAVDSEDLPRQRKRPGSGHAQGKQEQAAVDKQAQTAEAGQRDLRQRVLRIGSLRTALPNISARADEVARGLACALRGPAGTMEQGAQWSSVQLAPQQRSWLVTGALIQGMSLHAGKFPLAGLFTATHLSLRGFLEVGGLRVQETWLLQRDAASGQQQPPHTSSWTGEYCLSLRHVDSSRSGGEEGPHSAVTYQLALELAEPLQ